MKVEFKYHLWCILFLTGAFSFAQQLPVVKAQVDTTKIRIGEQINYKITIENADKGVQFSELELDSLNRIEIVESKPIDTLKEKLIRKYVLTSFDSGQYVIPPQRIRIWSQEYLTDSVLIDVATVAVDTTKQAMFPIKAIQREPYTFQDFKKYLWWLVLALLLIALILYLRSRKKKTPEEIEAAIPPYELALRRLKELDAKELWQKNKIKQYYVELTDILRNYIERELNIPALESTTDELIETMTDFNLASSLNIPEETIEKLNKLLKDADLVKFAKFKPLINEIELHRQEARAIIDDLKPKITVEENEIVE
ncbi:MAG: hypothetical protein HKN90_09195 [Flavobacteriaceae bacterium]|nr:hypothetical protein [Flavobacteriaceae bacterium]